MSTSHDVSVETTCPTFYGFPDHFPAAVKSECRQYESLGYRRLPKRSSQNVNFIGGDTNQFPDAARFDYQYYFDEEHSRIIGITYFGPKLEGPRNMVHGGAIATILDAIMGCLLWCTGIDTVTLNLNVKYRKFIPLGSFLRVVADVERREGKKIWVVSRLESLGYDSNDALVAFDQPARDIVEVHAAGETLYYLFTDKKGCYELDDYGFLFPKIDVSESDESAPVSE